MITSVTAVTISFFISCVYPVMAQEL